MPSAEDLRQELRRLLREAEGFIHPKVKQELASRAFELAQRAERIDVLAAAPGRLKAEIARYRSLLVDASLSPARRRMLREALADAESLMAAREASFRPGGPRLATGWLLSFSILRFLT